MSWGFVDRPAVTVGNAVGRGLIGGSGAKQAVVDSITAGTFLPSIHAKDDSYAEQTRITVPEAATLQSYPSHIPPKDAMPTLPYDHVGYAKLQKAQEMIALDLFAGTGWAVACRWLGIPEYGVDNMPEVVQTRDANDFATIFRDVWAGLRVVAGVDQPALDSNAIHVLRNYTLLIASPPCQTFSQAGKGEGRKALDQVLAAIHQGRYKDPEDLFKLSEETDPKTALVLTPLAYAYRDRPTYITFEQVPAVLPVWEACADVLRELGYSVWTGKLYSEQYGVPQTRVRAILIARNDGVEAEPPAPTHSKYYNRDPKKLDEGVEKWVSMAEALGWGTTGKPSYTVTGGGRETGGYEPFPTGARQGMAKAQEDGDWALRSNYGTNGDPAARGERSVDEPAATVTSKADRNFWVLQGNQKPGGRETYQQRPVDEPSQTITSMADRNKFVEVSSQSVAGGPRAERPVDEPAFTITQNSDRVRFEERIQEGAIVADSVAPEGVGPDLDIGAARPVDEQWKWKDTPSTTIAGDPRITAREHHYHGEQNSTSFRLELAEAEILQSYEPLIWKGTKGKQFLQLGNAVPPLLGKAILETFL